MTGKIKSCLYKANIAQMVEHIHGKDEVIGSIPIIGSKKKKVVENYPALKRYYPQVMIKNYWLLI